MRERVAVADRKRETGDVAWAISRAVMAAAGMFAALACPANAQGVGIGTGRTYAKLDVFIGADTRTRADPAAGLMYHVPLLSWIAFRRGARRARPASPRLEPQTG